MSLEIRNLAALYPPPHTKNLFYRSAIFTLRSQWLQWAECLLMPTAFAALSIVSVYKLYMEGDNTARGLISRDIANIYI